MAEALSCSKPTIEAPQLWLFCRQVSLSPMASTAHKTGAEVKEHYDPPEVLSQKVKMLAQLIRDHPRLVVWTGAGISTATGIPDFRGPNGKWTLRAQKKQRDPSIKVVNSLQALPSKAHMALVELAHRRVLYKLISSNCDGLHRRYVRVCAWVRACVRGRVTDSCTV